MIETRGAGLQDVRLPVHLSISAEVGGSSLPEEVTDAWRTYTRTCTLGVTT